MDCNGRNPGIRTLVTGLLLGVVGVLLLGSRADAVEIAGFTLDGADPLESITIDDLVAANTKGTKFTGDGRLDLSLAVPDELPLSFKLKQNVKKGLGIYSIKSTTKGKPKFKAKVKVDIESGLILGATVLFKPAEGPKLKLKGVDFLEIVEDGGGGGGGGGDPPDEGDPPVGLEAGLVWDFQWYVTTSQGGDALEDDTSETTGWCQVLLGTPETIDGFEAFPVTVSGNVPYYDIPWTHLAETGGHLWASEDGATFTTIAAEGAQAMTPGFFEGLDASRTRADGTWWNTSETTSTSAWQFSFSAGDGVNGCWNLPTPGTRCEDSSDFTVSEEWYLKPGLGPVGLYYHFHENVVIAEQTGWEDVELVIDLVGTNRTAADAFTIPLQRFIAAPLPVDVQEPDAVALDGMVWVVGGHEGSTALPRLYCYDPATNTWTRKADMGSHSGTVRATVYGRRIYVVGDIASYPSTNAVEYYDPDTNTWTATANLPENIGMADIASDADGVVVTGASTDFNVIARALHYDPAQDAWTYTAKSLWDSQTDGDPWPMVPFYRLVSGDGVVRATGLDFDQVDINVVWVIDPLAAAADQWTSVSTGAWPADAYADVAEWGSRALFVGGLGDSLYEFNDRILWLDFDAGSPVLSDAFAIPRTLMYPRGWHAAVMLGDDLYVIAGKIEGEVGGRYTGLVEVHYGLTPDVP